MASALLASRNEPCWGERKVYMRQNTNPNPNPNPKSGPNPNNPKSGPSPNPNSNGGDLNRSERASDHPNQVHVGLTAAAAAAVSDDSSSFNRKSISLNNRREPGGYVTFNVAACSRRELKELKRRLISELDQVRSLTCRIESREVHSATRSMGYSASGSYCGGREVTSSGATRPPPLHLNHLQSLDSPIGGGSDGSKEKRTPKANQYYQPSVFLTGKEKIHSPPLEAAENHKKLAGNKRHLPVISPREPKRPAAAAAAGSEKLLSGMMKKCGQILTKLMKHKFGWIFNTPVDVLGMGLHDYHQIIKYPMDLGTVKKKLGNSLYRSPLEFADDIKLTFNNALLYNPQGHEVYKLAEQLLRLFEGLFDPAYEKYQQQQSVIAREEEERQRNPSWSRISMSESIKRAEPIPVIPSPSPSPPPPLVPAPAPAAHAAAIKQPQQQQQQQSLPLMVARTVTPKQPKPRAKDPYKRDMSYEEKEKLSMGLQSLPQEKMAHVLQIIKRRNLDPEQHGDEIELDFEAMDRETLWELDRFVCNCKKMISKIKRQEATTTNQIPADPAPVQGGGNKQSPMAAGDTAEATEATAAKKNKKGGGGEVVGEEDVDIGEEMPSSNFPSVEIEKDAGYASRSSSSSSSSSSGSSSSSDSDSGSSSGSDSDADDAQSPAVVGPPRASPRN